MPHLIKDEAERERVTSATTWQLLPTLAKTMQGDLEVGDA